MDMFDIPIFAKSYELYKALAGFRSAIPKESRHSLWKRIEETTILLLESLLKAIQKHDKKEYLEQASIQLNVLRMLVRLAKDTRAIDVKKYVLLQQTIDDIGRMLGGWIKSVTSQAGMPPPSRKMLNEKRRKCRAEESQRLSLTLLSQLLLTFKRPSLTLRTT